MSREIAAVELNQFNAGLNTDASPLTSPDNSSLDEENMVLNTDGSRNRRLGMDFEDEYQLITTSIPSNTDNIAHTSFTWRNAGGDTEQSIAVVQFGNELKFFDLTSRPVSGNLIHTQIIPNTSLYTRFSYATVDGILVMVVAEQKQPYIFQYNTATSLITFTRQTIQIRDLFGVEDIFNNNDLYSSTGLQIRPVSLSQAHKYNLRNQGWGIPRPRLNAPGILMDPIDYFRSINGPNPSNSDNVTQGLFADPGTYADHKPTLERFHPEEVFKNPIGSTKAPQGYYIIDALERGSSRISNESKNRQNYPALSSAVTNLPADRTPGGASVVGEFAGRIWFGGFSGEVINGDNRSPRLSSYLFFSKLVKNPADATECYQEGDPTSKDYPDIVDTDGGFIRLNDAYGISKMVNLGDSLMILASNGVWRVTGTSDNGFTATQFRVEKISDRGSINSNSAVVVDNSITYWSDDGIYIVRRNEVGDWVSSSITINKIQRLYEGITEESKLTANGNYDPYERKVRWVYDNIVNSNVETRELILDVVLQAFYVNRIKSVGNDGPKVVSIIRAIPWEINEVRDQVTVNGDDVTVQGEDVYIVLTDRVDTLRGELSYVTAITTGPNLQFTFSNYTDNGFVDWKTYNGVGVDAEAFLVTSYLSGTDFQRSKQIPYITIHLRRTETGYDGNMNPSTPSSCITQARWDWSNSTKSGKWGREFQAYRYRRAYIPSSPSDNHNDGFDTVVTKNKLRGSGKVLSLKFRTEPGKDLHLYGWSMVFSTAGSV